MSIKEKTTLRLITTYDCNRNCEGCCNKQIAFHKNVVKPFTQRETPFCNFDSIILTGGEPLLYPYTLFANIAKIRLFNPYAKLILYTAMTEEIDMIRTLMYRLSGLTVTLHDQSDVENFMRLNFWLLRIKTYLKDNNKTLRLNVFKGVILPPITLTHWKVKDNIEWIEDCPLPSNELIRKL